jgi:hypothetical protein
MKTDKDIGLTPSGMVVAADDQISCNLDGEAAILNLTSGIYYGLNEVGATVWELISSPRRVAEIRDTLLECYDVEFAQCERDLNALLRDLASHRLIKVNDGTAE